MPVVLLILLVVTGCAERAAVPASGAARRVVSLHDVTTEMMVALGEVDRLVGVAEPVDLDEATHAALAGVPRVAGLESIMMTRPDLVLGLDVVAEQDPALVARLREAGIAVELGNPTRLDDVFALVRTVAARVDATEAGAQLVARLERGVGPTVATAAPVRVFVFDCCDPPFTAGGRAVLTDLIARAGGTNVFAELDSDWTKVSWEAVVARRPELIVIDAYRHEGQGDVADKQRALRAIPSLAQVPVVVMPLACALGGLRSVEGLARLRVAMRGPS